MDFQEVRPGPGESFGIWAKTQYELAEDPEHGLVIRPVRPGTVSLYRPPLIPNEAASESGEGADGDEGTPDPFNRNVKESPAIDLLNVLMGRLRRQIGETPEQAFKHWESCGRCKGCAEVKQRALDFANKWGLLGLFRLPMLGDIDLDYYPRAFGKEPRMVVERQEPLALFVRASAVFAEHYRELKRMESEEGTDSDDLDFDGGVAEALAGVIAERGDELFQQLREIFIEDPTVLWGWYEHHAAQRAAERLGKTVHEYKKEIQDVNQVIAGAFVGTLESLQSQPTDPDTRIEVLKTLFYYAFLGMKGTSPQANLEHFLPLFVRMEGEPKSRGTPTSKLRWASKPQALLSVSLNQILREVGVLILRRNGLPVLVYSFPTLWHAVHLQLALWIAREGRALAFCEYRRCGRAYLQKRDRGHQRAYCSEACRQAAYRDRVNAGENGR